MALLTTASSANKIVTEGLTVKYGRSLQTGNWQYVFGVTTTTYNYAWLYTRTARMRFKIVGLDYASAKTVAAQYVAAYTRNQKYSQWESANGDFAVATLGVTPMAEVSVIQVAGCMYEVQVNVNEMDTRYSRYDTVVQDISTLFTDENQRTYDD